MHATIQRPFELLPRSISVLVAGHRRDRLESAAKHREAVSPPLLALDSVLAHCARLCESAAQTDELFPSSLYRSGNALIRVITGQADGVDQHAIGAATQLGLHVDLVVSDTVLAQYRGGRGRTVAFGCPQHLLQSDDTPYAMRDELVLSYADVLVAIWDGQPARGRSGGVVRLIQRAVMAGLPVLWIDLRGQSHCVDSARMTEECLYRLDRTEPETGLLRSLFMPCDASQGILSESLRQRLNPLDGTRVVQNEESELLAYYASERNGLLSFECRAGSIQDLMSALFRLNRTAILRSLRKMLIGAPMKAYFGPAGHDPLEGKARDEGAAAPHADASHPIRDGLKNRFAWSDVRANAAGGRHRSSIWLLYLLASLAVFAAVAGAVGIGPDWDVERFWSGVEVACLVGIVCTVYWSRHRRWHRIWLGHRFMAEQIRYLVMLQPFLAAPGPFREPLFVRTDAPRKGRCLASAELWLLQRALSAEGFPKQYDGYELASADLSKLAGFLRRVIRHQAAFHKKTRERAEEMHAHMHRTSVGFFALAAFGVALHFCPSWPAIHNATWPLLLTACCPAFAAALHGIETKLEIERIAAQSQQVRSRLATMAVTVARTQRLATQGDWSSVVRLRTDAIEVASLLSQENVQWRNLIRHQATEIPA